MSTRFIMALSSVALVLIGAVLAYYDGTLFPKQMMKKYPGEFSFSFIANGAMWGSLILLSLVLYFIGNYADGWSGSTMFWELVVGMAASFAMFYFVYRNGKFHDSLAGAGEPISPAGWVIVFYFGLVIACVLLFYLSSHPTNGDVVWVGVLLALFIVVANHVPLNYLNNLYFFPWCPDIFAEESTPLLLIIGGEVLVTAATVIELL